MPAYKELMDSMKTAADKSAEIHISEDWMQGRTTYGGLSAALCLQAVLNAFDDLPPLRSAQITFIGPAGGDVKVTPRLMRQGRSVTYIAADVISEKGIATHAVFAFGAARESMFDRNFLHQPDVPEPTSLDNFFKNGLGPTFAQHFDCRFAKGGLPISGSKEHDHYLWVRHKDQNAQDIVALLALADMPPPAMLPMFPTFAPVSSMTWMMNFLTESFETQDGWWLMQSRAETAQNGYSSQDMIVWNKKGDPVIAGRQNVTIFI